MADDRRRRALTRKETKAITRARLLEAGLAILDEAGEAALTTINVTRRAGIAQSSFYVHFADMDDLLHNLIDELSLERLRLTRAARRESRHAPHDVERFRDTFRVPMKHSIAHPRLFRLLLRSRHDRTSPLGEWARQVHEESRDALIEDLTRIGLPHGTEDERRRLSMIADGVIALTEALTLGHLEGRYPDLEEAIDVLVMFSEGYLKLCGRQ
ncbi:TetR/AcrR family transcriptional regulator [Thermoactinospora rubra]|uniref:TetR/AcrR family transcriptional regulator n=1 Tax=Thermoactinospora rubra TaxID=1088767 RepID=UPI001301CF8B|nr:TetR/AcrR family transcriptional regulator [Thermoactinospora rubra]